MAGPGVWRLEEHIERLYDSMRMARMPIPFDEATLVQALPRRAEAQPLRRGLHPPARVPGRRPDGSRRARQPDARGRGRLEVGARTSGADGMDKGVRLKTSSFSRNHPNAAMSRAKIVGHYVNSIMARYEANDDGYDEALMLDYNGMVAEGTGENVFVVKNGVVKTPPVANILPGVTRRSVIEILEHEGYAVQEQLFGRDAFYVADEAFMCGTAAEVTPIQSLDRRIVGKDGSPGPITRRVQELYLAGVKGRVDWLARHITLA
jgi:branched-chain amino acid aminotransferase